MSVNDIMQFLAMAREHSNPKYLIADLEYLLGKYNIQYYGIINQPKPSPDPASKVLAGRWPRDWQQHYIEKRYLLVDPTVRYLSRADRGYSWRSALKFFDGHAQFNKMKKVRDDARKYGLKEGYTFPIHSANGLMGSFSFGGEELELTSLEILLFEQVAKLSFSELISMSAPKEDEPQQEAGEATVRELEILYYLADGMTSHGISDILRISSNTVDWHVNSLQEKYGARNRQHTVAIAFRRGLII